MNIQFSKIGMLVSCLLLATGVVKSELLPTLAFESGNKAVEVANCWSFSEFDYKSDGQIIGKWCGVTVNVQSQEQINSNNWIKSPWIKPIAGNITFKAKLSKSLGKNQTRSIALYYIPYDAANITSGEGAPVVFPSSTIVLTGQTVQNISVPVPSGIVAGVYKIQIKFFGSGGSAEILIDDILIPATYYSDPSHNCLPVQPIVDADQDGVADAADQYPNDPYRAYNNYYPAQGFGTLVFEDSWPKKGDYDLNDVVVGYKINKVTNSNNEVVEVKAHFEMRASGANLKNGFGFQLDGIAPTKISSVTGYRRSTGSYVNDAANGLEQGQDYATCIVFDNFFNEMPNPGSGLGVNTEKAAPKVDYQTIDVILTFLNNGQAPAGGKVKLTDLTDAFNFFIIKNKQREVEIHLPGRVPTKLADQNLFNTGDDASASHGYYKTANNLPWGLNVVQSFAYPVEKAVVNEAYLHFIEWAQSSGVLYPDWFDNKEGYRESSKIYSK